MSGDIDLAASTIVHGADKKVPRLPKGADYATMKQTAEDFEAFYLGRMLQPMFADIEAAEPFNGGAGAKIWRQMQVDEFGKALAKNGGVGIADMVMRQMIAIQEGRSQP